MLLMEQKSNSVGNMIEGKMYIGGKKVEGENGSLEVINPFNGGKVGSVPRSS